jgi:cytoplasmic tRNA 2-thiolation protein 2
VPENKTLSQSQKTVRLNALSSSSWRQQHWQTLLQVKFRLVRDARPNHKSWLYGKKAFAGMLFLSSRIRREESHANRLTRSCYANFISTKAAKRLESLQRSLRLPHGTAVRYLVGLSLGTSSTALLHIMKQNAQGRLERGNKALAEVMVVYVDPDPLGQAARDRLEEYRKQFSDFTFESLPLSSVFALTTPDWSSLPPVAQDRHPEEKLAAFLEALSSSTSRVAVTRLFTRHILLAAAQRHQCHALLLGNSTTSLAELALSETAQGRGFSSPWLIDEGETPTPQRSAARKSQDGGAGADARNEPGELLVGYPLREVFRRELATYATLTEPSLTHLLPSTIDNANTSRPAVVSHKDLGIQDVVARYFETVEEQYPSVVANVVRTTAKLQRAGDDASCAMCGMGLDTEGDHAWNGETNAHEGEGSSGKLCYACRRTLQTQ